MDHRAIDPVAHVDEAVVGDAGEGPCVTQHALQVQPAGIPRPPLHPGRLCRVGQSVGRGGARHGARQQECQGADCDVAAHRAIQSRLMLTVPSLTVTRVVG